MDKQYYEPKYLISQVAQILNIHPQTLRQYEREGLIKPSRTNGKIRINSQADLDNIKDILILTRDLGVNLAGVDIILKLKQNINQLQQQIDSYKDKLSSIDQSSVVPSNKALVVKKSIYEIVLV
jgi:MerR family transcriptional regulator/heat shock protein HspR